VKTQNSRDVSEESPSPTSPIPVPPQSSPRTITITLDTNQATKPEVDRVHSSEQSSRATVSKSGYYEQLFMNPDSLQNCNSENPLNNVENNPNNAAGIEYVVDEEWNVDEEIQIASRPSRLTTAFSSEKVIAENWSKRNHSMPASAKVLASSLANLNIVGDLTRSTTEVKSHLNTTADIDSDDGNLDCSPVIAEISEGRALSQSFDRTCRGSNSSNFVINNHPKSSLSLDVAAIINKSVQAKSVGASAAASASNSSESSPLQSHRDSLGSQGGAEQGPVRKSSSQNTIKFAEKPGWLSTIIKSAFDTLSSQKQNQAKMDKNTFASTSSATAQHSPANSRQESPLLGAASSSSIPSPDPTQTNLTVITPPVNSADPKRRMKHRRASSAALTGLHAINLNAALVPTHSSVANTNNNSNENNASPSTAQYSTPNPSSRSNLLNRPIFIRSLCTYVPHMVINRLLHAGNYGQRNYFSMSDKINSLDAATKAKRLGLPALLPAEAESYTLENSCILIADVSGFTKLNEMLANRDAVHAAETLTNHLNKYFTRILDIIETHNGDCVKFAGDALIVLFTAPVQSRAPNYDENKAVENRKIPRSPKSKASSNCNPAQQSGNNKHNLSLNLDNVGEFTLSGRPSPRHNHLHSPHTPDRDEKVGSDVIKQILNASQSLALLRNSLFSAKLLQPQTLHNRTYPNCISGAQLIDFLNSSGDATFRVDIARSVAAKLFSIGLRHVIDPDLHEIIDSTEEYYSFDMLYRGDEAEIVLNKLENANVGCVAALQAVQCGLALQKSVGVYSVDDISLSLHIAVSCGTVFAMHLGGVENEWEFLLCGEPFAKLSVGLECSDSGDVVVDNNTWQCIEKFCIGSQRTHTIKTKQPISTGEVKVESVCTNIPFNEKLTTSIIHNNPSASFGSFVRSYIPRSVLIKLDVGQGSWLAELRTASIIFVNLHGLALHDANSSDPRQAHQILQEMQRIINHNQGYRRQFLCDDKGTTLIIVFGVPPAAHEDNAARAVKTALELREKLTGLSVANSIGISSGNVYVGSVGSANRQEHAVVGDVVNLAARLSSHKSDVGIVVDRYTSQQCNNKFNFQAMGEIKVKGKANAIKIFHPATVNRLGGMDSSGQILGRRNETMMFMEELVKLQNLSARTYNAIFAASSSQNPASIIAFNKSSALRSPIIWIEGIAGIGRSALVRNFYRLAKVNVPTIFITADATEKTRSYSVWAILLEELLELNEPSQSLRREKLVKYCKAHLKPKYQILVPLLNQIFNYHIADNKTTAKLLADPTKLAESLTSLLVALVRMGLNSNIQFNSLLAKNPAAVSSKVKPVCIIVEDVHYIDSCSLNQLISVWESKKVRMLLLLTSREVSAHERCSNEHQRLKNVNSPPMIFIPLGGLDKDNCMRLVSQRLQVTTSVPNYLAENIMAKSKGNPLFAIEVAETLREAGVFDIKQGQIILNEALIDSGKEIAVPSTLKSLLIRRIDRLKPLDMLVCKLASVLGQQFNKSALSVLFTAESGSAQDLEQSLANLEAAKIIESRSAGNYSFLHSLLQQSCYELLLLSQRTRLHLAIAEWYEKSLSNKPAYDQSINTAYLLHHQHNNHNSFNHTAASISASVQTNSTPQPHSKSSSLILGSPLSINSSPENSTNLPQSVPSPSNALSSGMRIINLSPQTSPLHSPLISPRHSVNITATIIGTDSSSASTNLTTANASRNSRSSSAADFSSSSYRSGALTGNESLTSLLCYHYNQACRGGGELIDLHILMKAFTYLDILYTESKRNGAKKEANLYLEKCSEMWNNIKPNQRLQLLSEKNSFQILTSFTHTIIKSSANDPPTESKPAAALVS
jgi:class 3 adenylate cyclase